MKFLWIEDFDGGKSGKTETKLRLENYFQISDCNINIDTLEAALEFLDEPSNWNLFDAILIDIRFRVAKQGENAEIVEERIYKKYFESFLMKQKYDEYVKRVNDDIDSASSGILLYLALIYKYNYSKSRIAFVSANIDETSDKLWYVNEMRNIVYKARVSTLSEADLNDFSLLNQDLCELFEEVCTQYGEEDFDIPESDDIDWKNLDLLCGQIDEVEKKLKIGLESQELESKESKMKGIKYGLKYNSVKKEFQSVGLKVPIAFEKPVGEIGDKISWTFKYWIENKINVNYYCLRSGMLPVCLGMRSMLPEEDKMYGLAGDMMEFFPVNRWSENEEFVYSRIIRDIVRLCDALRYDTMDSEENIRKRILKYIRNWSSHQGIQDVSAIAVVFAVVLVVEEFISNVNIHEACLRLEELINQFGNRAQNIDKNAQKSIKEKEKQYRISLSKAYDKYKKSSLYNKKSSFHYDQNIKFWDVISAIGHQDSPIKETVSMKHLYILYLSCFKYPISDGDDINRIDKLLTELVWGEMCILENK